MARKFRKIKLPKLLRRPPYLAALAVLVLALIILGLFKHYKKTTSSIPSTKVTVSQPSNNQPTSTPAQGSSTPTPSSNSSPKTTTSNAGSPTSTDTLIAPSGTFVSNHQPSASEQEESFCNTSPNATCYIQFTSGNTTRKLDAQTANNSGSVYWTWKVSDAGLGGGSWQITAVASLNGQTKTTKDQIPLVVQP